MPELKVKKKTPVYTTKVMVAVSFISLTIFIVILGFGQSFFRNFLNPKETSTDSGLKVVKRENLSRDPLITLTSLKPTIKDSDPIKGIKEAPITIVEFGDFECPYSAKMKSVVEDVLKAYPDKVRLVWKDFPLTSLHDNAYDAARAARCSQLQGKFWEMHDLLLENYSFLSERRYQDFAKELGLNTTDFKDCLDTKKTTSLVDNGMKEAQDLEIEVTPHFFINTQEIYGTATFEEFKQLVDIELKK